MPTFCGEPPRFSSGGRVEHYKPSLLQPSNGEANPSSCTGLTEAQLLGSTCRSSSCSRTRSVPRSVLLTIRNGSFPHSSFLHTQPNELCLPYALSPEIARHEHLTNHSFHDETDRVPPGLASVTLACPPAVRQLDPHRVLDLPLDSPCGLRSSAQGLRVSTT